MRGETVAVIDSESGGTDSSGELIPGDSSTVEYPGCAVWPLTSEEVIQIGGDPVITHNSVAFPEYAEVNAGSQILIRSELFQVVGAPDVWVNFYSNNRPGIVVRAKRVTGNGG